MSKVGDNKPVYLIAVPADGGGERWLTTDNVEAPVDRVALAFATEDEALEYALSHVRREDARIVMFARVPPPSEE